MFLKLHVSACSGLTPEQLPLNWHLAELWNHWTYLRTDDFVCLDCGHGYNLVKQNHHVVNYCLSRWWIVRHCCMGVEMVNLDWGLGFEVHLDQICTMCGEARARTRLDRGTLVWYFERIVWGSGENFWALCYNGKVKCKSCWTFLWLIKGNLLSSLTHWYHVTSLAPVGMWHRAERKTAEGHCLPQTGGSQELISDGQR